MANEQRINVVDQSADVQGYVYFNKFGQPVAWTPGFGPYIPGLYRRYYAHPYFGVVTSLRK